MILLYLIYFVIFRLFSIFMVFNLFLNLYDVIVVEFYLFCEVNYVVIIKKSYFNILNRLKFFEVIL